MKSTRPSETSATEGQDEGGFGPLLVAWDRAHPAPVADPDWRHLLDEMVHPGTTRAFHRLAEAEAVA
ncbi:hypothetical protein ACSCB1_40925 [Streptomyces europaeiscabiei]|uniref:Uncharacterized protein n=1 Tax=Streptomyces europaeiscabiei TaxID=146819 RepID=A0ABU4NKV1_9ACTN|nr:hypothetical protein [Streptomyces europaeiscabiei]MDX2528339.1 hypothetical protein [Streptomyces europaeiscabiei]MDX2771905.1 hypothetical protein [Streptomyces europaeiscabiei]MDX3546132.1 hypothetical protein [Streptomyces europaeiscabiei]MDX3557562.1 hypothetical protein [Streptomyces europaeiscabiei]MDX3668021.1 hypothetical protein [Streptomyces europaeiscabiei]